MRTYFDFNGAWLFFMASNILYSKIFFFKVFFILTLLPDLSDDTAWNLRFVLVNAWILNIQYQILEY